MNGPVKPWFQALIEPAREVGERVVAFLPSLVGATLLLLCGWVAARLIRVAARRLTSFGLARLARLGPLASLADEDSPSRALPEVVARFAFWTVLLLAAAAAIEALGLPAVSGVVGSATAYVPRVLATTVLVVLGLLLGGAAYRRVLRVADQAGMALAEPLARAAQVGVVALASLVAIDNLGIDSRVLLVALGVGAGAAAGAMALAFGLGARTAVANVVAGHYVRQSYRVGDTIRIGDAEGQVVQLTRTAVLLETSAGRVLVPAGRFGEEVSVLLTPGAP